MCKGSVNGSTADFHGSNRVQDLDSTLERLKVRILVWKHAKSAMVDAEANARMNVLFRGLEPSITGSLCGRNCEYKQLR